MMKLVFPTRRWAATFGRALAQSQRKLSEFLGFSPPPLLDRLIEDAQKITSDDQSYKETLATATQPRCEA